METTKMIPYGAALLGAVVGNWLYKKKPMYGNIGRGVAIGAGAAGGYFISNAIINRLEKKEIESVASANARVSEPSGENQAKNQAENNTYDTRLTSVR